jgi:hypothetical protein
VISDTEANAKAALDAMTSECPADAPPVENMAVDQVVLAV